MPRKLAILLISLSLLGVACTDNNGDDTGDTVGETDTSGEEFTLTGLVIDAKADVEPEGGFPEDEIDGDHGGIAVRPEDDDDVTNLDDCDTEQDAYVTYYTPDTDLGDLDDDENFPESLEGQRVSVEGVVEQPNEEEDDDTDTDVDADADVEATDGDIDVEGEVDTTTEPEDTDEAGDTDDCVLILTEVELEATETDDTDDGDGTGTGTGTGDGDADASPGATGSPSTTTVPGSTPGLPSGVEDTDPIFEGTPSPDPCEGAKACAEED